MGTRWEDIAEALMTERYPRLLARARMLAASEDEAADLVQSALMATFQKRRGFATMAQAEQYVRRAIVTAFADAASRGIKERERWERATHVGAVQPDHAATVQQRADVRGLLMDLAPRVRACVALRYLEDLSIRETAQLLGLSEGAVKRYVSDGLAQLNAALGTQEGIDDPDLVDVTEGQVR